MSMHDHHEQHFLGTEIVRDVVIGLSDGLTVPFALVAGLSGTLASTHIVVVAGAAEIAAGAIAMGLGGYLAARTEFDHYHSEYQREWRESIEMPEEEGQEVALILREQGLDAEQADSIVRALSRDREKWVRFMMRFELGLTEPDAKRAPRSASTIGVSYVLGGLVPLLPYLLLPQVGLALRASVALTLTALLIFGSVKGRLTGVPPLRAGIQTLVIGGAAAAAAFLIARLVSGL